MRSRTTTGWWRCCASFPTCALTFNLVPSLVVQLEAFAEDRAQGSQLELGLKPADRADRRRQAVPARQLLPRAAGADDRRRTRDTPSCSASAITANGTGGAARQFTDGDFRDLQVWHKLAWVDPFFVESDPRVRGLVSKGRGFSEDGQGRHCGRWSSTILRASGSGVRAPRRPAVRWSSRRRRSTTRFCRCCATPTCTCGRTRTRGCRASGSGIPKMRAAQLDRRSVAARADVRPVRRVGLWPSEGSVSDAMVPLADEAGFAVDGDRRADPRAQSSASA